MGTLNPSIIPDMVSQSIKDYCSLNCSVNICGLVISYADSSLFLLASWRSQHMRLSHFHAKASRLASIFYAKSTSSNARIFLRLQSPLHTQSISHATSILRMHIDSLLNAIKDIYIYIYIYPIKHHASSPVVIEEKQYISQSLGVGEGTRGAI